MRTFNEWMQMRSPGSPIKDWLYVSEGSIEDAWKFLETEAKELFRDMEVGEPVHQDGKIIIPIKGDPKVTLFELEAAGISNI